MVFNIRNKEKLGNHSFYVYMLTQGMINVNAVIRQKFQSHSGTPQNFKGLAEDIRA